MSVKPAAPGGSVASFRTSLVFISLAASLASAALQAGASSPHCPGITCHSDGSCLPLSKRCDGVRDCVDGIDEVDCDVACDLDSEFDCGDGTCVHTLQRCDGQADCSSGKDERHCEALRGCRPSDFICDGRRCLPRRSRCNGARDCFDGTDESSCRSVSCLNTSFACASKDQCIPEWQECDGRSDCRDSSDENRCARRIKIFVSPPVATARVKDRVSFHCTAKCPGRMPCIVRWSLAGEQALPREAYQHGNALILSPVAPWSSADYVCSVADSPGISASARLIVQLPQAAAPHSQAPSGHAGRTCELACPVGYFYARHSSSPRCVRCSCWGQYCDPCSGTCSDCPRSAAGGYGWCEGRTAQRYPALPKAIACDPRGTIDGHDSPASHFSSACSCKANVIGPSCDQCKAGSFYLSRDNPDGCITCVCSGITTNCVSSSLQRTSLSSTFVRTADGFEFIGHEMVPTNYAVVTMDAERAELRADMFYLPRNHAYYWKLPKKYTGNRLVAYGGMLKFTVSYVPSWDTLTTRTARVIIKSGNELHLAAKIIDNANISVSRDSRIFSVKVQLMERSWINLVSGGGVSRSLFLRALSNITEILIEAAAASDSAVYVAKLGALSMDVAGGEEIVSGNVSAAASQVEQCSCPRGYTGLSCEVCESGYYRRPLAPWGVCVKCHCNGHSEICDRTTGECLNCRLGTEGHRCERCADGWTGDATLGTPHACAALLSGVVQVLEDRLMVGAGDTAVLTCEYRGASTGVSLLWSRQNGDPVLPHSARLDKGRLIILDVQPSDAGHYKCIARAADGRQLTATALTELVVDAPPNCPPCSRHGSQGAAGSRASCSCRCKRFVEGSKCETCIEGYFDLHRDNEDGCRPCFCSGLSQNCTSSDMIRYQKQLALGSGTVTAVTRSGAEADRQPSSHGTSWLLRDLGALEQSSSRSLRLFWSLPRPFTGYQGDAYGGHFEYSVEYKAKRRTIRDIDIEIVSQDKRVHHTLAEIPLPEVRTHVRVAMTEQAWRASDGSPLMRADFMRMLANVTSLLVRLTHAGGMIESSLHGPRLSGARAAASHGDEEVAREVEHCICPVGYAGASCQECQPGYKRSAAGDCVRESVNVAAEMQGLTLLAGSSGHLVCPTLWRDASYSWKKVGDLHLPKGVVAHGAQLLLPNATEHYDGDYVCTAVSSQGTSTSTASVSIVSRLTSPRRLQATVGSSVEIECSSLASPGFGTTLLSWYSERGQRVTVKTPLRSVLKFGFITPGHSGNYTCIEEGSTSSGSALTTTELVVLPRDRRSQRSLLLKRSYAGYAAVISRSIGSDVVLNCSTNDVPRCAELVAWSRSGSLSLPDRSHQYGCHLRLNKLQQSDEGVYECTAKHGLKQLTVVKIYLLVVTGSATNVS